MSLDIATITFDCVDPDALAAWWAGAAGGDVNAVAPGEFVLVARPGGPALGFQRVDDPTPGKNRLHLDLHAADMEGEVARLVGLGARETGRNSFGDDFRWVVLADPEGNAFCVAGNSLTGHNRDVLISLIVLGIVLVAWSLVARRLESWRVTAPMVLVLAGMAVGFGTHDALAESLNSETAQRAAEIILAILLFVDAADVRGGLFGRDPRSALRVLFIAMPLALAAAVLLGLWLLPGLSWAALLIIACIVVPIDFAPAASILRDDRIPERVRNTLNVEAGYNDGIISPIFIFALVLAGDHSHAETPLEALGAALPQALKAILVGVAVGAAIALLNNLAERRHLMTEQSQRIILVVTPLLAYTLSIAVGGNGFVSAFVGGIAYTGLRRSQDVRRELELLDDVGFLLTVAMWFVFGAVAVIALSGGIPVELVVFCLLALTLVRLLPVALSLLGSGFSWPERALVGALGPRGTTSIVFGLLAFNVLADDAEGAVLLAMVVTVLGSVLIHGIGAPVAARAINRAQTSGIAG